MSYYSTLPYFLQSLDSNGVNTMFHRVIGDYLHMCSKHEGLHQDNNRRYDFIESLYEGVWTQWFESNCAESEARDQVILWAINALQNRLMRRGTHHDLPDVSNTHSLAALTIFMRSVDIGATDYSLVPQDAVFVLINEGLGLLKCFPGMAVINDQLSRHCFDSERIAISCYRLAQSQVDLRVTYRGDMYINSSNGDFTIALPSNLAQPSVILVDLPLIARKIHDSVFASSVGAGVVYNSLKAISTDLVTTVRILEGVGSSGNDALICAMHNYLSKVSSKINGTEFSNEISRQQNQQNQA